MPLYGYKNDNNEIFVLSTINYTSKDNFSFVSIGTPMDILVQPSSSEVLNESFNNASATVKTFRNPSGLITDPPGIVFTWTTSYWSVVLSRGNVEYDKVYIAVDANSTPPFQNLYAIFEDVDGVILPSARLVSRGSEWLLDAGDIIEINGDIPILFKSNDGLEIYHSVTTFPSTAITISYPATGIVNYTLETAIGQETGTFNVTLPRGKTIVGFAMAPNSDTYDIALGQRVEMLIDSETAFYAVLGRYSPLQEYFPINIYRNSAEDNRVDKTEYLTLIGTINGALRNSDSVIDLSLTLEYNGFPNFNYVHIPMFGRYYYIVDIVSVRTNLWEISLVVDVLMTYKDSIKKLNVFVDRNEFQYNRNIIDKKRVISQGFDSTETTVANELFDGSSSCVLSGFYISVSEG